MRPGGVNDITHRKCGLRFEKKQLVEFLPPKKTVDFLSSPSLAAGAARGGGRWKSQHRKVVYHSPYVEKPFNSKVIKRFVPEQRSCKCFCVSGFLCYLYVRYGHYECFAYRYEYVYFTYRYHGYVTHREICIHTESSQWVPRSDQMGSNWEAEKGSECLSPIRCQW